MTNSIVQQIVSEVAHFLPLSIDFWYLIDKVPTSETLSVGEERNFSVARNVVYRERENYSSL